MSMSINPGDIFECIADDSEQIYIIESALRDNAWSVVNTSTDWMYILTETEIREKFRFVYTKSEEDIIRLQKFYNPTLIDLQERVKSTAHV